jgi:hypothetical protein
MLVTALVPPMTLDTLKHHMAYVLNLSLLKHDPNQAANVHPKIRSLLRPHM